MSNKSSATAATMGIDMGKNSVQRVGRDQCGDLSKRGPVGQGRCWRQFREYGLCCAWHGPEA
jgi:hypothetical protein